MIVLLCLAFFQEASAQEDDPYITCITTMASQDYCLGQLGRESWYPASEADCRDIETSLRLFHDRGWYLSWKSLFFNERCARLGWPHFSTSE
ncbi:MAG: hypothetical protein AAF530_09885 [Pseudomonadota bacterium]